MAITKADVWIVSLVTLVLMCLAIPLAPIAIYLCCSSDVTQHGLLLSESDWPEPIRNLHMSLANRGIDVRDFEAFMLSGRPKDTDSTVLCRLPYTAEAFAMLETSLELKEVAANTMDFANREAQSIAPPGWWPQPSSGVSYFASRSIREGDEGYLYAVAIKNDHQLIFIYYYYNF